MVEPAKGFAEASGFDDDYNPTSKNLMSLLKSIGIEIVPPSIGQRSPDRGTVAFTNASLCLKDGGAQGDVQDTWFDECGRRFLKPFIELVSPKVVVALGLNAFVGVMRAFGMRVPKSFTYRDYVEAGAIDLAGGVKLFPVYHCGAKMVNMTRKMEQQVGDWEKVGIG